MTDEFFGEVISSYTDEEAINDGILVDLTPITQGKGLINIATTSLIEKGYIGKNKKGEDIINIPNVIDLLNQGQEIVRTEYYKNDKKMDDFYSGEIELPSGDKQKVFIARNGTGKFTMMLPEDY